MTEAQREPHTATERAAEVQQAPSAVGARPGQVAGSPGQVGPSPGQVAGSPGQVGPSPGQVGAPAGNGLRQYAAVWRIPGAPMLIVAGVVGRLPIGMAPLALVLLVQDATGAYTNAGAAAAVYALANAVGGPLLGRLADRRGPTPVLLGTAFAYPVGVIAVLAAILSGAPFAAVLAACVLLGLAMPPLTAALRSVWADLTSPPASHLREPALAAETTVFEVVFVLGPMLVGGLSAIASPAAALVATGVLTLGGTAAVALGRATRASRPHPDQHRARGLGPLLARGMPMLLLITSGLTFAFGVVGVAVPAFADLHTAPDSVGSVSGMLLGLWGVGSVTGGVWFGTRTFSASLPTQWAVTLSLVAVGMAALTVAGSVPLLAVALLAGGCTLAPALTVENGLVARIAPPGMLNEAYTWLVTVAVASGAAGSAVAGVVVDRAGGVPVAFTLAAITTALGAMAASWPRSSLRRATAG